MPEIQFIDLIAGLACAVLGFIFAMVVKPTNLSGLIGGTVGAVIGTITSAIHHSGG